eukprot:403361456
MLADFIKLITLQCSLLSSSMDYDFKMNLNLIFVQVPALNLGYEGFDWESSWDNTYQVIHYYDDNYIKLNPNSSITTQSSSDDHKCLNTKYGMDSKRTLLYQNFAKDNIVFLYEESPEYHNKQYFLDVAKQWFEEFKNQSVHIRVYFARAGAGEHQQWPKVHWDDLLVSYWQGKPKHLTFSGSLNTDNKDKGNWMKDIIQQLLKWNKNKQVKDYYGFKSRNMIELKNEFLEVNEIPKDRDFIVFQYSDDCKACLAPKKFYEQLADAINYRDLKIAHSDMTASIFWGIWPYELPQTRWYNYTTAVIHTFEYLYLPYRMEAYYKFLSLNSVKYKIYLIEQKRQQVKFNQDVVSSYNKRHCHNFLNETQGLMNYMKFHNVDYDHIVDMELRKAYVNDLEGYHIVQISKFGDVELNYPFFQLNTKNTNQDTKIAMVGASLYETDREKLFLLMLHGYMILGIQSYRSWPIFNQWEHDTDSRIASLDHEMQGMLKYFSGWLHNQPDPQRHFNNFIPRMNFGESDLQWSVTNDALPKNTNLNHKKVDVCFVNGGDSQWHSDTKNYTLAIQSFEEIIKYSNFSIMIIGRKPPEHLLDKVKYVEFMPFSDFLRTLAQCDILFNPSISDASPRIITQALTVNTAIIVNKYISGGWKYVNEMTGSFIGDQNDVIWAIQDIKDRRKEGLLQPRAWFEIFSRNANQKLQIFAEIVRKEIFL